MRHIETARNPKSRRTAMLCAVGTMALLASATMAAAQAQDPPPPGEPEAAQVEEIVVTGSRIRQPNLTSESPLQSVSEETVSRTGSVLVSELLNELPQFGNALSNGNQGQNTTNSAFNTGVELVNLRNLGVQRTLVLVNGRRHIGGDPGTSSVDLNSIPSSMIERVDVVTGAASAVYGADAVSGVVNVILKSNFEGLRLASRTGISSRSDDADYQLSGLLGGAFDGGRGHALVGAEYYKSDGFIAGDRPYGQSDGTNGGLSLLGGSTGIPGGRIVGGSNGEFIFDSSNRLVLASTAPVSEQRFQRTPVRSQQAANERFLVSMNARYDLISGSSFTAEGYLESTYANAKTSLQIEPQVMFFQGLPRLGTATESSSDGPRVSANNPFLLRLIPTIGAVPASGVQVLRRFAEQGPRFINVERETFRFVTGVRGQINDRFDYDLYYQYGNVKSRQDESGVLDRYRLFAALNVNDNGTPGNLADDRCVDPRYVALGCTPLNLFGVNSISQDFLRYATIPSISNTDSKQTVVSGFVSGELFTLPAGPVNAVLGFEYRKEESQIDPASSYLDHSSSVRFLDAADGEYDVTEQFAEVRVPILADKPFAKSMSIGAAVRFSDYSTVGSQTSWNVRGDWAINDWVRLRGTTGTAVRAPNINELYAPISRSNVTAFDPCDRVADDGSAIVLTGNRATNCTTALGALAPTLNQTQSQRQTVTSQNQGDSSLQAEDATTYTAGVVFTPRGWMTGASLSIDYYEINIDKVISSLSVQDTVNQCYDQPGLPTVFCGRVLRDPTNGQLISLVNQLFNAATEEVSGVDFQFNYGFDPADLMSSIPGRLDLRASYALLLAHDFTAREGAVVDERLGQVGDSESRVQVGVTYSLGGGRFSWDSRFLSEAVQDKTATGALALNNGVPEVWTHDIQVAYELNDRYLFTAGVTNLFDEQPPFVTSPARTAVDNPVAGGIYDVRGRFFYVSAAATF